MITWTKPFEKNGAGCGDAEVTPKKGLDGESGAAGYCDQVTEDLSFLGPSPQMVRIRQQILQIAQWMCRGFLSALRAGGKEVVARMSPLAFERRNSRS